MTDEMPKGKQSTFGGTIRHRVVRRAGRSPKKVTKPISSFIPPITHTKTGWVHRYWARKPWNVVRGYVEHYTKEGDIILDPFCGSGVTVSESLISGRRAIGIDLNPVAILISDCVCCGPIDVVKLRNDFESVIDDARPDVEPFFETNCPGCGRKVQVVSTVWNQKIPESHFLRCSNCGFGGLKRLDAEDLELMKKIESISTNSIKAIYAYPEDKIEESSNVKSVDELFSKRNLIAICYLKRAIEKVKNKTHRDLLRLTLSASLEPMSGLPPVRQSRYDKEVSPAGSWYKKSGFWVPPRHVDGNVIFYFSERFEKIVEAKKETNATIGDFYRPASNYEHIVSSGRTVLLSVGDARDTRLPDCSVHYIHTDPPYGDAVPYLLSSTMWNGWLREKPDWDKEIVMGSSPDSYKKGLIDALVEMHRVLKPGGYLTIWFHYKDPDIWFALLGAARHAGFEKVALVPQKHAKKSSEQGDSPTSTIKEDWVVTFRRLSEPSKYLIVNGGYNVVEIKEFIKEHTARILSEMPRGMTFDEIYNKLLTLMINKGIHHKVDAIVTKSFLLRVWAESFIEKDGLWYFDDKNVEIHKMLGNDRAIQRFLASILNAAGSEGADIDKIHKELFEFLDVLGMGDAEKKDIKLKELLRQVGAIQLFSGKYTLNLADGSISKSGKKPQHNGVVFQLADMGHRLGYSVHIGRREQSQLFLGKKLADFSDDFSEELHSKFTRKLMEFVEQIDVIWSKNGELRVFEIEMTTGVTKGCERIVNLIDTLGSSKMVRGYIVVLGTAKDDKLVEKHLVTSTVFKGYAEKGLLRYILVSDLDKLYKAVTKSPDISVNVDQTMKNIAKGVKTQKTLPV